MTLVRSVSSEVDCATHAPSSQQVVIYDLPMLVNHRVGRVY